MTGESIFYDNSLHSPFSCPLTCSGGKVFARAHRWGESKPAQNRFCKIGSRAQVQLHILIIIWNSYNSSLVLASSMSYGYAYYFSTGLVLVRVDTFVVDRTIHSHAPRPRGPWHCE